MLKDNLNHQIIEPETLNSLEIDDPIPEQVKEEYKQEMHTSNNKNLSRVTPYIQ